MQGSEEVGGDLGEGADRPRRRRSRPRPPRAGPPPHAQPHRTRRDPRARRQPPPGLGRPHDHRPRPQTTATDPDRRGEAHRRRDDDAGHTDLLLRWKGGALTELTIAGRRRPPTIRTDEDTVDLIRRLAVHYPDAKVAGILNRQGRRTARDLPFTAVRVASLRQHWNIPGHPPGRPTTPTGGLLTIADAAKELGIAPSTLHRWIADGFVAGEQDTPGAPWRIRMTDDLRALFVDDAPEGWLAMLEATLALGVSRQTVLQRVKRGELKAVHVRTGRRKGLRIQVPTPPDALF